MLASIAQTTGNAIGKNIIRARNASILIGFGLTESRCDIKPSISHGGIFRLALLAFIALTLFCFVCSLSNVLVNVNNEHIDKAFVAEYNICEMRQ